MLPLTGITVLALEQAVAAPFATRQLADLGARVIKIERPGVGDFARGYDETLQGLSSYFAWLNRSKESLTLNLKHPEASHIMHKLLAGADVFVQNLSPGAMERIGLGTEVLTQSYPRLIVCDISGYGSTGPYRDKKAYDLLVQCETGLVSITGTPETPSKAGISIADISAGMYGFSGILTALYQRERTGKGASLEVSLFESLGEWMGAPAYFTAYSGTSPARNGATHATIAPYGPFRTGDGKQVNLGIQNEREWATFCTVVLKQPDLAQDPRFESNSKRVANREALHAAINAVFSQLTSEQVIDRLDEAQIANAHMNSMQEFWEHPQLEARQRWREVDSPAGTLKALRPPVTMDGVEPRMDRIPAVGEQTESILEMLGYTNEQIDQLRIEGAI
jgi:crotonobetainyl-CoA:carnitine CoA-transferase CaiB-like acyl-CoA transferase